jgi:hypothetical protein
MGTFYARRFESFPIPVQSRMLKLRGGIPDRPRTAMGYIVARYAALPAQAALDKNIQVRERGGDLRADATLMRGKERDNVHLRLLRYQ